MVKKLIEKKTISRNTSSNSEILTIYGLSLSITIIAWIIFEIQGYPLVVTAKETLTYATPAIYMIPIFIPLGILLGELIWDLYQEKNNKHLITNLGGLSIIAIVSGVRIFFKIPLSGHSLILSYFILHEIVTNKSRYIFRIMIGCIILLLTSFYKIFLWQDFITLLLGFLGGIIIWGTNYYFCIKLNTQN